MDRPTHCDQLLGGHWPAGWSDEDEPPAAGLEETAHDEELQALLSALVESLVD